MDDLREYFIADSLIRLDSLLALLNDGLSDPLASELFRTIHTIKGTARTFGLRDAAGIASAVEDELAVYGEGSGDPDRITAGVVGLIGTLKTGKAGETAASPETAPLSINRLDDRFVSAIPEEIRLMLSTSELAACARALRQNRTLFSVPAAFTLSEFAAGFDRFAGHLKASGSLIATIPGEMPENPRFVSLRLLFEAGEIPSTLEGMAVTVIASPSAVRFRAAEVLELIASHAKELAAAGAKEIEIEVRHDDPELSPSKASTVFYVLLHLIRNAVAHGIDRRGKIGIGLDTDSEGLTIKVSDDGRGIDLKELRASERRSATRGDDLSLIFRPGFSTAPGITEIAGRGIGMDAVMKLVEAAGGSISVSSEPGRGTAFEVRIPD